MTDLWNGPLQLETAYKERVWGGQQLQQTGRPVGEAWILHEDQPIVSGPFQGRSLRELAQLYPAELLGRGRTAQRFPLLIKLLDCQEWLSVQVHPNDQQARKMVGPRELGKTEAWYILQAQPAARLILGTREGVTAPQLRDAILGGQVTEVVQEQEVRTGETLLVPAGTLHAIGPGLLIYEVQQTSDTTYRVYDWDRPSSDGRELHLQHSAEVARPGQAQVTPAATTGEVTRSDYFVLEHLNAPQTGETSQQTPHILTVIEGELRLRTPEGERTLARYQTVLLPAALGQYELSGQFEVLRASLPALSSFA